MAKLDVLSGVNLGEGGLFRVPDGGRAGQDLLPGDHRQPEHLHPVAGVGAHRGPGQGPQFLAGRLRADDPAQDKVGGYLSEIEAGKIPADLRARFAKAGMPGWACLIPVYNVVKLLHITGRSGWWLVTTGVSSTT